MANTIDSEENVNMELFEEVDAEDNLETQIHKLQEIKDTLGDIIKTHAVVEYDAKDIIQKLERHLFINYDTTFLIDYYNVLKNNNAVVIKQINITILSSIQQAVRRQRCEEKPFEESEVILMAAWLSVAALCGTRPALAAQTLHALLAIVGDETIDLIARMWQRTATTEMLLELADAARAPLAPATSSALADMLLRGALHKITAAPDAEATQERGALRAHEVAHVLDTWCPDQPLRALFRVAARVLAEKRSDSLMASVERAARAGAHQVAHGGKLVQVTTPTTFRLLFGKKDVLPIIRSRKRKLGHHSKEKGV